MPMLTSELEEETIWHFLATLLLWLGRSFGVCGLFLGLLGAGFGGPGAAGLMFLVCLVFASVVPRSWYEDESQWRGVAVAVMLGFLGPIGVAFEEGWREAGDVIMMMCVPLLVFVGAVLLFAVDRRITARKLLQLGQQER